MIDLHQHTIYSDGYYSIDNIIDLCNIRQLKVISITDHDTLGGQEYAYIKAKSLNIKYIFGIEISTIYKSESVHILGYFKKLPSKEFENYIKNERIKATIKRAREKKNTTEDLGYYNLKDVIDLIHKNNGLAILAHPILYKEKVDELAPIVDGIECIYPAHSEGYIDILVNKCKSEGLYCTAGTDFHNDIDFKNYYNLYKNYNEVIKPFLNFMCD